MSLVRMKSINIIHSEERGSETPSKHPGMMQLANPSPEEYTHMCLEVIFKVISIVTDFFKQLRLLEPTMN